MTTEERAERSAVVGRMVRTLVQRRDARAKAAKQGKTPDPKSLPGRNQRDDVDHLSKAQKELYRECFPDGEGGIDYEKFQECFEQFANGELRNPGKPGEREPDGGYFFLFAEFAFLAVAIAENPAIWKRLLRTFVKCQEIFIDVYRPAGGGAPRLDDYKAKNFRKAGQANDDKKKRLREKYKDMSPGQIERAATDNMKRAQAPK